MSFVGKFPLFFNCLSQRYPFFLFRSATKKRPAKKRASGWARGVDPSRKRKRVNHLENGNVADKSVNGVSGDDDKDHSNNEMSGDEVQHSFNRDFLTTLRTNGNANVAFVLSIFTFIDGVR